MICVLCLMFIELQICVVFGFMWFSSLLCMIVFMLFLVSLVLQRWWKVWVWCLFLGILVVLLQCWIICYIVWCEICMVLLWQLWVWMCWFFRFMKSILFCCLLGSVILWLKCFRFLCCRQICSSILVLWGMGMMCLCLFFFIVWSIRCVLLCSLLYCSEFLFRLVRLEICRLQLISIVNIVVLWMLVKVFRFGVYISFLVLVSESVLGNGCLVLGCCSLVFMLVVIWLCLFVYVQKFLIVEMYGLWLWVIMLCLCSYMLQKNFSLVVVVWSRFLLLRNLVSLVRYMWQVFSV